MPKPCATGISERRSSSRSDPAPGRERPKTVGERLAEAAGRAECSEKELEKISRESDERDARVRRHPLAESSLDYVVASTRWLDRHEPHAALAEPVREAVGLIGRDSHVIRVKIVRALTGRDGSGFEDAVQTDWNGSAKVALLSIERSEAAWRVVARLLGGEAPAVLAETLGTLREDTIRAFPRARQFQRPGFDDPR